MKMKMKRLLALLLISFPMLMGADDCSDIVDLDGDGYSEADGDCDDNNPSKYPGAPEFCGIESDCEVITVPHPGDYFLVPGDSIQETLREVLPGDVICLAPGLFEEAAPVAMPEGVALVGALDEFSNPSTEVRMVLTNQPSITLGAGDDFVTLYGIAIDGNSAGGVECMNADYLSVFFSSVTNNGGGMRLKQCNNALIEGVYFGGNSTGVSGGGLYLSSSYGTTMFNSQFVANSANENGGGLFATGGVTSISNTTFEDNAARKGGGAFFDSASANGNTVIDSRFNRNTTEVPYGGGIDHHSHYTGTLLVEGSTFNDNTGAVSNPYEKVKLKIVGSTFKHNSGDYVVACLNGGGSSLWNNLFEGNHGEEAILQIGNAAAGVSNNLFTGNTTRDGGTYLTMPGAANPSMMNNIFDEDRVIILSLGSDPGVAAYNHFRVAPYGLTLTVNDTTGDPDFVDNQFHLSENSPCVDSGNPQAAYNDLNGTRNDKGLYGGPTPYL